MINQKLSMFENISFTVDRTDKTLVDRIEQGCLTLERFFSNDQLTVDMNTQRSIKNRRKYLQSRMKSQRRGFGFTNGREFDYRNNIMETGYIGISGDTYPDALVYHLRASIPAASLMMGETIFVALADTIGAYCSQLKTNKTCDQLQGYNQLLYARERHISPQGRPDICVEGERLLIRVETLGLRLPRVNGYPPMPHLHRAQPFELGWLNYWSAETCHYIGFPDLDRDQDLLELSYQTPGGAWLVKICEEPLDLDRDDHLTLFAELYQRFPKLGLREAAVEPQPPFRYPEHTAYIHKADPRRIAEKMALILQSQGYKITENPPKETTTEGVTVGFIRGAEDWTLVKTIPEELLASHLPGQDEPLLAQLCQKLRHTGFTLSVYSEFEALLLEADGKGHVCRSGIRNFDELPEDVDFETMEESGHPPLLEFRLNSLDIETGAGDFDDYGQIASELHKLLAGQNVDFCDDQNFAASLDEKSFKERQGVKLCFVIPER